MRMVPIIRMYFLVSRMQNGIEKFRVNGKAYIKIKHDIIRIFNELFPDQFR